MMNDKNVISRFVEKLKRKQKWPYYKGTCLKSKKHRSGKPIIQVCRASPHFLVYSNKNHRYDT